MIGAIDDSSGPGGLLVDVCGRFVNAAKKAGGKTISIVAFPGAGHAFDVKGAEAGFWVGPGGIKHPVGYQAAAAQASLVKLDEFLSEVFK